MRKTLLKEFGKAQVSSLVSAAFDFLTTAITFHLTDHVAASTAAGAIVGGIINCTINYKWTFHGTTRNKKGIAWRYLLVWIGSILLNTFGTEWAVKAINHQSLGIVMTARVVVAALVAVGWNFTLQRHFVYKRAPHPTSQG